MKTKLFITGGSGLLGTNWAIWNRKNYKIILGINKRDININDNQTVKVNFSTLENTEDTIKQVNPDIIVNTIGLTNVDYCEKNPNLSKIVNETIPSYIAKVCDFHNIPLIHISTDHLFDGNSSFVTEKQKINPLNEYARCKAKSELLVTKFCPKALIVRTNFFGWGPSYRQSFSDFIILSLRKNKEITLFVDIYFTPILIDNLIKIIYKLIEKHSFGIFNIVSNERLSKYEFGIKLANKFNLDLKLIKMGSIDHQIQTTKRPKDMSLSNKKVSKNLNISIESIDNQISLLRAQENFLIENPTTLLKFN